MEEKKLVAFANGKEALLAATIRVVASGGLRALTYRAVANEAGVSHGLVRHHFGTRAKLVEEALTFSVEESLKRSNMRVEKPSVDTFAQNLEALFDAEIEIQSFQYELLLESRRRPELQSAVAKYYAAYEAAIADQLHRLGVTDEAFAEIVWFALDGLVFKQLVHPGDVSDVLQRLRTLIRDNIHQ